MCVRSDLAVWLKSTGAWATLLRGDFPEAAASTGMSTPGLVAGDQAKIALYGAALVRYDAFEWELLCCKGCVLVYGAYYSSDVLSFCDNSLREKVWCCRKCGAQAT